MKINLVTFAMVITQSASARLFDISPTQSDIQDEGKPVPSSAN